VWVLIDGTSQVRDIGNGVVAFVPNTEDGQSAAKELHENRVVRHRITTMGAEKQRSVIQLNLLMASCQFFADNTENPQWDTKEKVKFQLKVATDFRDPNTVIVSPDGQIHFLYRSFSFAELKHMDACRIFERCYDILCHGLGMDLDDFITAVKSTMRNY